MFDMREVEGAIAELENGELTYSRCGKLADLYTIRREHMAPETQPPEVAVQTAREAPARVRVSGGSDFMQAVAQVDFSAALDVLDELMSTLEIVNPKAYKSVMRRLEGLK